MGGHGPVQPDVLGHLPGMFANEPDVVHLIRYGLREPDRLQRPVWGNSRT
jgi:hypothetical protein